MGRTNRRKVTIVIVLFCVVVNLCSAQDVSIVTDTLTAANKVAYRGLRVQGNGVLSDIETIVNIVTPMGEGDAIKLVQILPGISAGAEASSAIYARGGNMGNNLMSLDGVSIYGISHLLGITSSISSDAIGMMDFQMGGFDADRGAALSSFIKLKSAVPKTDRWYISGVVSPFFESVAVEGPVLDRTGVLLTVRFSPAGIVYNSVKGIVSSKNDLRDLDASIYDVYGKVLHKTKRGDELVVSIFRSMDDYDIKFGKDADTYKMGWSNTVGQLKYTRYHSAKLRSEYGASYNVYENGQGSEVLFNGTLNLLKIKSSLTEFVADGKFTYKWNRSMVQAGGQFRRAEFNPGASILLSEWTGQKSFTLASVLWGQYEYRKHDALFVKAAARINAYKSSFVPEFSFLWEYNSSHNVRITATVDRTIQLYHTLEGMPFGWSMDLIVPSDATLPFESAYQGYLGVTGVFCKHKITIGGYYKTMENLVYYTNAANLFSASRTGWKDNVETGKGSSYGVEALYEYSGERLYARTAYTLSKTDRTFKNLNDGNPFPAKFDRRHVLNASAEYSFGKSRNARQGVNVAFTFQSGHWESYKLYSYPSITPDDEKYEIPYFGEQPNNFRMPNYIRLDMGYFRSWKSASGKTDFKFRCGIYNTFNRHNPFLLMYDDDADQWMELSLMPIMPSVSFRVGF